MTYLTKEEFDKLGFEVEGDFDKLLKRAELAIDAYIRDFYSLNSFDNDNKARKKAVKRPVSLMMESGALVGQIGQKMTDYQNDQLMIYNMMRGII